MNELINLKHRRIFILQICRHCCHSGWSHSDSDTYESVRESIHQKFPCSLDDPGESHGICDGFGTCQCVPPFIGPDCSIRDCLDNCNNNGWCSTEFPVSRCVCNPGYFGASCEFQECLNNCSYPRGICNTETGKCKCRMVYNPYNNKIPWRPLGGEDCSYIPVFANAPRVQPWGYASFIYAITAAASLAMTMCVV